MSLCPSVQRQVLMVHRHLRVERGAAGHVCPDGVGKAQGMHGTAGALSCWEDAQGSPASGRKVCPMCPRVSQGLAEHKAEEGPPGCARSPEGRVGKARTPSRHLVAHSGGEVRGAKQARCLLLQQTSLLAGADVWFCSEMVAQVGFGK